MWWYSKSAKIIIINSTPLYLYVIKSDPKNGSINYTKHHKINYSICALCCFSFCFINSHCTNSAKWKMQIEWVSNSVQIVFHWCDAILEFIVFDHIEIMFTGLAIKMWQKNTVSCFGVFVRLKLIYGLVSWRNFKRRRINNTIYSSMYIYTLHTVHMLYLSIIQYVYACSSSLPHPSDPIYILHVPLFCLITVSQVGDDLANVHIYTGGRLPILQFIT